ncbi:12725_t:CDS:2 [Funneliformis caledonium]|uniref:12725_t:CDS:1 n=1 Tax=Funneliformis caledonium TaxID=1117310 RepID=A0A9N9CV42_9GLOM|nr:12725_t:CDS:2 [Funneliformis caledonium]
MLSSKSLVITINIFLFLIIQSTLINSFPSTKQEIVSLTDQEVVGSLLTEQDIDSFNGQDTPLFEQDIGTFYCQNGSSLECCPLLARQFASKHHSRVATIVLINNSGHDMEMVVASLESGRWITSNDNKYKISCEPQIYPLENGQAEAFSSVTSHFLGGVKGHAIFSMNDDISSNFVIFWSVPVIGSPTYDIYGLDLSDNYNIFLENDLGTNDPSEKRNRDNVPNLDAPPEYRDTSPSVPIFNNPNFDAPPSYSSIPNRGPGNKYSITHPIKAFIKNLLL